MIPSHAKKVAEKLDLVGNFSSHCFPRSSTTFTADVGADIMTIKHQWWLISDATAQGYVDHSKIAKIIVVNIFNKQQMVSTDSSSDNAYINAHSTVQWSTYITIVISFLR